MRDRVQRNLGSRLSAAERKTYSWPGAWTSSAMIEAQLSAVGSWPASFLTCASNPAARSRGGAGAAVLAAEGQPD
jgi:hypothetical protein